MPQAQPPLWVRVGPIDLSEYVRSIETEATVDNAPGLAVLHAVLADAPMGQVLTSVQPGRWWRGRQWRAWRGPVVFNAVDRDATDPNKPQFTWSGEFRGPVERFSAWTKRGLDRRLRR